MTPHELVLVFCFTEKMAKNCLLRLIFQKFMIMISATETSHNAIISWSFRCDFILLIFHLILSWNGGEKSVTSRIHLQRWTNSVKGNREWKEIPSHMAPRHNLDIFPLKTVLRLNEHRKVFCNPPKVECISYQQCYFYTFQDDDGTGVEKKAMKFFSSSLWMCL